MGNSLLPLDRPEISRLAQEERGVGGGTRGSARERAACGERSRTGSSPNKPSPPAQRSFSSERGFGGSQPLSLHPLFPKPNQHGNQSGHCFQQKRRSRVFDCGYAALSNLRLNVFAFLRVFACGEHRRTVPSWLNDFHA